MAQTSEDEKHLQAFSPSTKMATTNITDTMSLTNSPNYQSYEPDSSSSNVSNANIFPSLNYSLTAHKKGITITWSILLLTTLILPILLYFILKYPADSDTVLILAVTTALFGVSSLFNLIMRTYKLLKPNSTVRPLSGPRWAMDYFNLNFLSGFIWVTVVITIGNVIESVPVAALGLPLLIIVTGLQLCIAVVLQALDVGCPIRISSVPRGADVRGGVYAIAEDIIGVDSDGGRAFREAIWKRWEVSEDFRKLCFVLDIGWGFGAVVVGAICVGLMLGGIVSDDAAWAIGWAVPWGFAGVGAVLTVVMCKMYLRKEQERYKQVSV